MYKKLSIVVVVFYLPMTGYIKNGVITLKLFAIKRIRKLSSNLHEKYCSIYNQTKTEKDRGRVGGRGKKRVNERSKEITLCGVLSFI